MSGVALDIAHYRNANLYKDYSEFFSALCARIKRAFQGAFVKSEPIFVELKTYQTVSAKPADVQPEEPVQPPVTEPVKISKNAEREIYLQYMNRQCIRDGSYSLSMERGRVVATGMAPISSGAYRYESFCKLKTREDGTSHFVWSDYTGRKYSCPCLNPDLFQ